MTGQPFLNRRISRQSGVLFFAAEGAGEVRLRINAVVREKCAMQRDKQLGLAGIRLARFLNDAYASKAMPTTLRGDLRIATLLSYLSDFASRCLLASRSLLQGVLMPILNASEAEPRIK